MTELHMMESPFTASRVVTSEHLTERRQHSRSPSRAKRRAAQGHRQHFITAPSRTGYMLPDGTLVVHPEMADAIARSLRAERERLARMVSLDGHMTRITEHPPAPDDPLTWEKIEALARALRR